jgi:hypothetical protein
MMSQFNREMHVKDIWSSNAYTGTKRSPHVENVDYPGWHMERKGDQR